MIWVVGEKGDFLKMTQPPPLPSAEGRGFPHLSEFLHGLNITFLSFTAGRKGVIFPHLSEFLV